MFYDSHCSSAIPGPTDVPSVSRHPEYYFDDGNLVLQVENVLFRVFRSTFNRHSAVFREVLAAPADSNNCEGESDRKPFLLLGISAVDFERLLSIIYPPVFGVYKTSSAEEWISVLHLATRWEFDDIRSLAIKELQTKQLDPVDRIVISQEYDITSDWTLSAYTILCQRARPLTVDEARRLGIETATRISQLRERLRGGSVMRRNAAPGRTRAKNADISPTWTNTSRHEGAHQTPKINWSSGMNAANMAAAAFGLKVTTVV
ncbi:hypothetical protein BD410DRAFT_512536 [Rickenella mellea]|uniref:BTB domain-containing protein n=1 Tax=Rickenella mellea TaxID=50990 RepID=A0A4Y7PS70_9AGAM|nr:hypothetical protein BD410DRAFT_512536 [Rickenella mellea]